MAVWVSRLDETGAPTSREDWNGLVASSPAVAEEETWGHNWKERNSAKAVTPRGSRVHRLRVIWRSGSLDCSSKENHSHQTWEDASRRAKVGSLWTMLPQMNQASQMHPPRTDGNDQLSWSLRTVFSASTPSRVGGSKSKAMPRPAEKGITVGCSIRSSDPLVMSDFYLNYKDLSMLRLF
jgi:hypothetical protein